MYTEIRVMAMDLAIRSALPGTDISELVTNAEKIFQFLMSTQTKTNVCA